MSENGQWIQARKCFCETLQRPKFKGTILQHTRSAGCLTERGSACYTHYIDSSKWPPWARCSDALQRSSSATNVLLLLHLLPKLLLNVINAGVNLIFHAFHTWKSVELRSGHRCGLNTGASGPRPIQLPGQWMPDHFRAGRLTCACAPSCKNHTRCHVYNAISSNRGKWLWRYRRYGGPVSLAGIHVNQWEDRLWFWPMRLTALCITLTQPALQHNAVLECYPVWLFTKHLSTYIHWKLSLILTSSRSPISHNTSFRNTLCILVAYFTTPSVAQTVQHDRTVNK